MSYRLTRRQAIGTLAWAAAASGSLPVGQSSKGGFKYCLNTATIRGQRLPLAKIVQIAAETGYDAVEPWLDEVERAVAGGETYASIRRMFEDRRLACPSLIAFPHWIVDDRNRRKKGIDEARRAMEVCAEIGSGAIAAPPAGATSGPPVALDAAAERYARLLEIGAEYGVVPQLELWGFSRTLGRLSEAIYVAVQSGRPDATLLLDVFHLYKGGSGFDTLHLIHAGNMRVFHVNDYPARPSRETVSDRDRVYPGDGIAPWKTILAALRQTGFRGYLSVELFNRAYWQQPAEQTAAAALRRTKAVVDRAS